MKASIRLSLLFGFVLGCQGSSTFLQVSSVTPGVNGTFSGGLGSVQFNGAITTSTPAFQLNDLNGPHSWEDSTLDGTSPQFSYSNVFVPSTPLTDRIGYTSFKNVFNPAVITVNFSSPVVDPIFLVANLDSMIYDFSPNPGIHLVELGGNGGGGDGLFVIGDVILDANPQTGIGQDPSQQPLLTGARSGYGSIELFGTFSQLTINVANPNEVGDGGSFTFAETPEPRSLALAGVSLVGLYLAALCKRRRQRN